MKLKRSVALFMTLCMLVMLVPSALMEAEVSDGIEALVEEVEFELGSFDTTADILKDDNFDHDEIQHEVLADSDDSTEVEALGPVEELTFEITDSQASIVDASSLIGKWKGYYTGNDSSKTIEREIIWDIDYVNNGTIEGFAAIDDGRNGSYYFSGTLTQEDRRIHIRGTDWKDNPSNFSFSDFDGTIDVNGNTITGSVNNKEDRPFSLNKISNATDLKRMVLDTFPLEWVGEYDGSSGSTIVRRNYRITIQTIDDDGTIKGIANVSPSEKADPALGVNCSYYFQGKIDARRQTITLKGYQWIDYPENYSNFTFLTLDGDIDHSNGIKIKGTSTRGIWEMSESVGDLSPDIFEMSANAKKTIYADETFQIIPKDQTAKSYKASPTSVASVTQSGVVKGLKAGKATITVTLTNKKTLKLTLTVEDPTAPSKISINSTDKEIMLSETRQLSTTMTAVKSGYTAASKLTWKSNKSSVLSVDKNGKLTARKAGTATITVTTANKLSDSVTITVIEPSKPKTIVINAPEQEYVPVKGTLQLTVKMTALREPVSAKLTWKSNNTKVAAIDKNGKVTGKSDGTAKITVTTDNKLTASIDIRVRDTHAPTSVKIKPLDVEYLGIKDKAQLTAVMTAIDEPVSKLTWKSLDTKVASVDSKGVVTGKKEGVATITVTTANKLSATLDVTVKDIHAPTGIRITPDRIDPIDRKSTAQLEAVMTAIGTPVSKLTWTSSDTKVATVDKNGKVTGKKEGDATITVKTANGLSASIDITVEVSSSLNAAFRQSSDVENWLIRYYSIAMAKDAYTMKTSAKTMESKLSDLGFGDFDVHLYGKDNGVLGNDHKLAYIIGYKDISNADGTKTRLFAVICRGTGEKGEWGSNLTVGSGTRMYGFDTPAQMVSESFRQYFNSHLDGKGVTGYKVWVTGHSRGAAVANLLAGYYFPGLGFSDDQIYGYTFACPNVSKGKLPTKKNIFNYCFGGDLVARVPFTEWGYSRYGRTYTLKNGSKVAGYDVIDNATMERLADRIGTLSDKDANWVLEKAKEDLAKEKGSVSGGIVINMLLKALQRELKTLAYHPVVAAIDDFLLSRDVKTMVNNITNTHQSETYYDWVLQQGSKLLF